MSNTVKLIIEIPKSDYKAICENKEDAVTAHDTCRRIARGISLDDVKGTKYYKANDVIKVLLDNGYGDEENGADPEYMTALHDVYRGLDDIPVYAITKKEEARYNADMLKAFNAGIELAEKEKESDLDHYTRVKEWAKNNGFVLVTEEWYDKARVAYYWRYYGKRSESR